MRWEIFCRVIDNYGDIGVCWRLAAALAAQGRPVCLRVDDDRALAWMAPQGAPGVQVLPYDAPWGTGAEAENAPPQAVIEAFGCEAPPAYLQAMTAQARPPVLVNLEYLSAEAYVERCHGLPSPLPQGPGAGLTRWFFYPGFTPRTGGLLREADLAQRQAAFDRPAWRSQQGLGPQDWAMTLFCYEPPALAHWLGQLVGLPQARLLVTPGRATQALHAALGGLPAHWAEQQVQALPARSQRAFDELLWGSDLNLVRGEDSLVRALWAGQALVWQIYPQDDQAHHAKLQAFLDWLDAPPSLRAFHQAWNGLSAPASLPLLCPQHLHDWRASVQAARQRLWQQPDLLTQLQGFVDEKS